MVAVCEFPCGIFFFSLSGWLIVVVGVDRLSRILVHNLVCFGALGILLSHSVWNKKLGILFEDVIVA